MDLMQIGVQLLQSKLGGGANSSAITSALGGLLGGQKGGFDIGSMVSKMQGNDTGGDFTQLAKSWLGDGGNDAISTSQVSELLGKDKVAEFASQLNVDEGTALGSLTDLLPQMVDKSSSGGSLLDSVGGIGGLMGMASKFMK